MIEDARLALTARLLDRGRQLERLSDGISLLALAFGLAPLLLSASHPRLTGLLCALLLVLGAAQKYFSVRVALDAGLIASLAPQASPTNKVLAGVTQLVTRYSYGQLKSLLQANVCPLEDRQGIRVVRGITTEGEAFSQITTRRIVDFAKAGIRQVANPFVGRLNNERVRTALHGALDSFLTTMVVDEALTGYQLEVKATRADEIAGRCIVNVAMQPTFSIDYIRVTLALS